ncbi:MAG: nicotinate (nicotinamide) nucleotide adenylyltransferase [Treponema sp.]|jgi:nicotinate-nucleotide adenylyltransferase|nr:nicotinate (nicotinamide) nucleotide adenylyltransferase [Treponema sp.]
MRFAILGGSFNPVHTGHLFLAETALTALGYDRIILVPAHTSPFKPGAQGASPRDRLDMLIASIPGDSRLTVDDCEIRREGVSFTVDTVKDIIGRYRPQGKPGLILGDDLARDFHHWRRADELAALVDIIIAHRLSAENIPFPYPCKQLDNEILELSSGTVRDRIAKGQAWSYLVSPGARFIIRDRRLYGLSQGEPEDGGDTGISEELIAGVETTARSMLSPARFFHSRNVALLARDLCRQFGLDPRAGYLAGIAHDMCKSLSEEELFRLTKRDGRPVSRLERKKPSLLHARAGAVLLKERFGVQNRDILDAVRLHTLADPEMGPLAKAVFIADKIEISRERVDASLRDIAAFPSLDALFLAVLDNNVAYLRSRKLSLSKGTLRLLNVMKGEAFEKDEG